jgi:hypothetical protein
VNTLGAVVRAPNSVILVGDPAGEPPESMGGRLVSATPSCVAIGTLSEADGETTIQLIDANDAADLPTQLAFEGDVEMTSNRLTLASVLDDTYLERPVRATSVSLQVWVNDADEPDEICVVIG